MTRLSGKVALITGAASGIGRATAERFVAEGAIVVLADRAEKALAEAYAALCDGRPPHRAVRLDVTDEQQWIDSIAEIGSTIGRLDILVNNAGGAKAGAIAVTSLDEWRAFMALNLDSVFLGTKHALPLLARSGKGSIVNVSSIIGGQVALSHGGSYAASKAGVRGFTKATALECAALGNGIRANSVHPGQTETPLLAKGQADAAKRGRSAIVDRIPMGRLGIPREIADAILFLASDEASFVTGTELIVDGGYTAQ